MSNEIYLLQNACEYESLHFIKHLPKMLNDMADNIIITVFTLYLVIKFIFRRTRLIRSYASAFTNTNTSYLQ
jgi:hypothetical protein